MRDAQDIDVLTSEGRGVRRPLVLAFAVAAVVLAADQATKQWALSALEPGFCGVTPDNCIDLFAGIKFHLVFNTGSAFSAGTGLGPLIGLLASFMVVALFFVARNRNDWFGIILFGAVAGGALGNLWDRLFRAEEGLLSGAVVDFIDLGWWPVFNVADMAIVGGVVAIMVMTFFEADEGQSAEEPSEESQESGITADAGEPEELTDRANDQPDTSSRESANGR